MNDTGNSHTSLLVGWALRYLGQTVMLATGIALVVGLLAVFVSRDPFIAAAVAALAWLVTAGFWLSEAHPPPPPAD